METGPVDVYIIGFPGNKFTGRIAPAIRELVENGTIRILDLLFVMKDADGVVMTLAIEDLDQDGAAFAELDITEPGSLNEEDAEEVSEDLPANSSALLIAFENVWARKVVSAFEAADAVLIDSIRIPAEVVDAALACAHRIAALPRRAVEDTKRLLNIPLERSVLAALDFAFAAEDRSFTSSELRANLDRFSAPRPDRADGGR